MSETATFTVVGYEEPTPESLEIQAEALHGRPVERLGYETVKHGAAEYEVPKWPQGVPVALRMRGKERGLVVKTPRHPDPAVEAFRWRSYEGEKVQVIHRLRPVNRTRHNRVVIETVGNAVLPVEVDEFIESWDANLPNDADMLRAAGFMPEAGAKGSVAMIRQIRNKHRPHPWASDDAAMQWLRTNPQPKKGLGENQSASPLSYSIDESWVEDSDPKFHAALDGKRFAPPVRIDIPTVSRDPHLTIADAIRAHLQETYAMSVDKIELDGLPFADVESRIDSLTLALGDEPTIEQRAAFVIEVERLYAMMDAHDEVTAGKLATVKGAKLQQPPAGWAEPVPAVKLASVIPRGPMLRLALHTETGFQQYRFFPEGGPDGAGIWTDLELRPIEPPEAVRAYGVRYVAQHRPHR